jgi:hypothetical protein
MENNMTIEFIVAVDDYIAFNLFHFKNSPTFQRQLLLNRLVFTFIIATICFLPYFFWSEKLSFIAFLLSAVGGIVSFLVYPRIHEKNLREQLPKLLNEGKNEGVLGKQKIIITPEALINETPAGEQKVFWNSADKIAETNDYIFLYVGSMSAAIIPLSAFPSMEQKNAFLELVKQYYHASTGRTLPIIS